LQLILCRHGNTFLPGEIPTWVGKKQDLALTPFGREQAESITRFIKPFSIQRVVASPLKRTLEFARIIANAYQLDVITDTRLT
jgi:broad specificity phosphatase PhoE